MVWRFQLGRPADTQPEATHAPSHQISDWLLQLWPLSTRQRRPATWRPLWLGRWLLDFQNVLKAVEDEEKKEKRERLLTPATSCHVEHVTVLNFACCDPIVWMVLFTDVWVLFFFWFRALGYLFSISREHFTPFSSLLPIALSLSFKQVFFEY